MNRPSIGANPADTEAFLSGAYRRISRVTIVVGCLATIAAALYAGLPAGIGAAIGSLVGYLNFVWLHYGAKLMVDRILDPAQSGKARLRLMAAFVGRYLIVMTVAYVILKGYARMRVAFMVGLLCPIVAAIAEGVYEAFYSNQTSD